MTLDELIELTDGVVTELVPLPVAADDVCPQCQSCKEPTRESCWSCRKVYDTIGRPCRLVIPISFYMTPGEDEPRSPLRERMHDYKESDDPSVRAQNAVVVGGILVRYLLEHGDRLREIVGRWDASVAVPSKKGRSVPPLTSALDSFSDLMPVPEPLLVAGPGEIGRYAPHPDGFEVVGDVAGLKVVLIDDTFTTGATLQSAASALVSAGAEVLAGVVVARKINPNPRYSYSLDVWERQSSIRFDFGALPFWTT